MTLNACSLQLVFGYGSIIVLPRGSPIIVSDLNFVYVANYSFTQKSVKIKYSITNNCSRKTLRNVLLGEGGFTHSTLQQHLHLLAARGLVAKEKMASNNQGRPKFTYRVPSTATKQLTAALQNPHEPLVTLQFSRLRHLCRFEKGGYCKEAKKELQTSKLPPNQKIRIITILHQFRDKPAL